MLETSVPSTKSPRVWKDTSVARTRPGLTRDAILAAALRIIDESGLDACTMRAVAAELGVEAMSLYWHVPGKDALLDGVVELVLGEVDSGQGAVTTWQESFVSFAHTFRGVLRHHPNVVQLVASRPMTAYIVGRGDRLERALGLLEAAGFDRGRRPCAPCGPWSGSRSDSTLLEARRGAAGSRRRPRASPSWRTSSTPSRPTIPAAVLDLRARDADRRHWRRGSGRA